MPSIVDGILPLDPTLAAMKTLAAAQVPTRIQVNVEFLHGVQSRFERENGDLMLAADYADSPYLHEEAIPALDCLLRMGHLHALANTKRVSFSQLQEQVELSMQYSSEERGHAGAGRHRLPVRLREHEVIQQVHERLAGDDHFELAHIRIIRLTLFARHVYLRDKFLAVRPCLDPLVQEPPPRRGQLPGTVASGVAPVQLLPDRFRL